MAYIVIVGILAVIANFVADLIYAVLDPTDPGERMSYPTRAHRGTSTRPTADTIENAIELKDVEGLSQGQIVRRRFFRHRGAMVGLVVLRPRRRCSPTPRSAPSASPAGGSATTSAPATSSERRRTRR